MYIYSELNSKSELDIRELGSSEIDEVSGGFVCGGVCVGAITAAIIFSYGVGKDLAERNNRRDGL